MFTLGNDKDQRKQLLSYSLGLQTILGLFTLYINKSKQFSINAADAGYESGMFIEFLPGVEVRHPSSIPCTPCIYCM